MVIPKRKSGKDPGSYRPKALTSCPHKLERMLTFRIGWFLEMVVISKQSLYCVWIVLSGKLFCCRNLLEIKGTYLVSVGRSVSFFQCFELFNIKMNDGVSVLIRSDPAQIASFRGCLSREHMDLIA